jgi:hypothetical protein
MIYLRTYGLTVYVPFIVAGAAAAPLQPASRYLLSSFMVAAFVAFYVVRLGGDFMEWRFLTPVTGLIYPSIVAGASLVAQELFRALSSFVRRGFACRFRRRAEGGRHARERDCPKRSEQGFETAPEKRGLLSPNGVVDFRGLFAFALRSRRILAASRRAVCERIDSLVRGNDELNATSELAGKAVQRGTVASKESALRARLCGWVGGAAIAIGLLVTTGRATPNELTTVLPGQETVELLRRYADPGRYDWRAVARVLDEIIPPEARIATTSAGIIPYFCDRPCLDLHGLTDPEIAHAPIDEERRGRMGHEHWLDDPIAIRRRGVDVLLPWADPSLYPRALVNPPIPEYETVSVRLADHRYVDFLILNPDVFDRAALARDPRLVFHGMEKVADKKQFYAERERFTAYNVIDHLDLLNGYSENTHDFREEPSPDAPLNVGWYTKFLRYPPPLEDIQLEDDGRRVYGSMRWKVFNLHASTPLVLLARFAREQVAHYEVAINGRTVPERLSTRGGEEAWDESFVIVPAELVVEGTNELRMSRAGEGNADAEFYSMWFLQPRAPEQRTGVGDP